MNLRKLTLALSGAATLVLTTGSLALATSAATDPVAATSPFVGGQPLAPWVLIFGFLLMAEAMWLMDPAKVSKKATGTIVTLGGIIVLVNGFLILNNPSTLGTLAAASSFITTFTIVYGFFFTALGIIQIHPRLNSNVLGPLAMFISFFSLATSYVFYSAGATYHAIILAMVFIAFLLASLAIAGKVTFKTLGWWMSITSGMLIIAGFLWSLAPSLQGVL